MTDGLSLALPGGLADLTQESDLLLLIAAVAEHGEAIREAVGSIATPGDVLAWLPTGLDDPNIDALFAGIGLTPLLEKLKTVRTRLASLPPEAKILLAPVGAFLETEQAGAAPREGWIDGDNPGLIAWTPSIQAGFPALGPIRPTLSLAGSFEVEAGALWPFRGDAVPPGLLRISASGSLSVAADAVLPFRFGSAHVAAGQQLACSVHFFFRAPDANRPYAAALADALIHLPDPFDPAGAWEAFSDHGLEGCILTFDGGTEIALDVGIGKDVEVPALIKGELGGTLSFGLIRQAAYQLSLRHSPDALIATLSRDSQAGTRWGAGIGVTLDLSGLATRVHDLLSQNLGAWDAALEQVKPLLLPGDWLRGEGSALLDGLVSDLVQDATLATALRRDIGLAIGQPVEGDSLAALLQQRLSDAISSVAGTATTAATTSAASIADTLAPLTAFADPTIRQRLETGLATTLTGYAEALSTLATQLVGQFGVQPIEQALTNLGITVDGGVHDANSALTGIRALIDRYDGLLHKIVAETANAARAKVTARLAYEERRLSGAQYEIKGRFTSIEGAAAEVYRALTLGRLTTIGRLFETDVAGFQLDPDASSIRRFAEKTGQLGYTLLLLGLDIAGGDILTGKAEIWRLGNGDVQVASEGGFERWRRAGGETRSLSFASAHALLIAHAETSAARPFATLSLAATHADQDLRRGEVTGFLTRLVESGLLAEGRRQAAEALFDSWAVTRGGDEKIAGTITILLTLDPDGIAALIAAGRAALTDPDGAGGRFLFGLAVTAMQRTGDWDEDAFRHDARICRDVLGQDSHAAPDPIDFFFRIRKKIPGDIPGPHGMLRPQFNRPRSQVRAASALAALAARSAAIFDSTPAPPGDWTVERYRDEEGTMAEASAAWLRLNGILFFPFKQEMHRRTVAFFLALATLARGGSPDFDAMIRLAMQRDGGDSVNL